VGALVVDDRPDGRPYPAGGDDVDEELMLIMRDARKYARSAWSRRSWSTGEYPKRAGNALPVVIAPVDDQRPYRHGGPAENGLGSKPSQYTEPGAARRPPATSQSAGVDDDYPLGGLLPLPTPRGCRVGFNQWRSHGRRVVGSHGRSS
jgi:hypothetical protein